MKKLLINNIYDINLDRQYTDVIYYTIREIKVNLHNIENIWIIGDILHLPFKEHV